MWIGRFWVYKWIIAYEEEVKNTLKPTSGDMFSLKDNNPLFIKHKAEVELKHYVDETSQAFDANSLALWKEHNHRFPNVATYW